jgi:predicted house-cleaning NTP pyrophosphatase (Maf/HAM1 superfamily)
MLERIKTGANPTELFREIFSKNPELSNYDLAEMFRADFEKISGEAIQAIWYWRSGRGGQKGGGYNDDQLNLFLIEKLQESGYLPEDY